MNKKYQSFCKFRFYPSLNHRLLPFAQLCAQNILIILLQGSQIRHMVFLSPDLQSKNITDATECFFHSFSQCLSFYHSNFFTCLDQPK